MKNIVIYGLGDFAKLMHYYFSSDSLYEVVAFCADKQYIIEKTFCNLPVVDFDDLDKTYFPNDYMVFVAVGYSNMRARIKMYNKVKSKKYLCPNYINSSAEISENVNIGENNAFFMNVVVEPFSEIGNNNIIWSSSTICHDVTITDHSFIAAQSIIGGFSHVGRNCFIGFNATILQNLILADETLVAAKSLIKENTDECAKYIGDPAKKIGTHRNDGIVL